MATDSEKSGDAAKCMGGRESNVHPNPAAEAAAQHAARMLNAFRPQIANALEAMRHIDFGQASRTMALASQVNHEALREAVASASSIDLEQLRRATSFIGSIDTELLRQAMNAASSIDTELVRRATSFAANIDFERLREAMRPRVHELWEELWRRYRIAERQASQVLSKYKWLITPSLPASLVFEVVKEGRKTGRRDSAINALFVRYFSDHEWGALGDMVEGWSDKPLLANRMKVLRDCVKVLRASDRAGFNAANVVLPTLIAQVDGLFSDYLDSNGVPWEGLYGDHARI